MKPHSDKRRIRWTPDWLWLAALALVLSLHFWFPKIGPGIAGDTYSTTAEGKKAYYLLADRRFDLAARSTESLSLFESDAYSGGDIVCLLGPARYPTESEWDGLLDWVSSGGGLLFAARNEAETVDIEQLGVKIEPAVEGVLSELLGGGKFHSSLLPAGEGADVDWHSTTSVASDRGGRVLVEQDDTPQAILIDHGAGRVVIVATDSIFSNESLLEGDNSVLALRLLEVAGNPAYESASHYVYFDESLNVSGTPKVVGLLLEPFLRPVTVQLLACLIVFGWWQSRRFGPMLPAAVLARHNIVDHTDTVGNYLYKSGDGTAALKAYSQQLIAELRLKHFKGRETRIIEPIARRLGKPTDTVLKVLQRATAAAENPPLDRKTAAKFIRRLALIRMASQPADV